MIEGPNRVIATLDLSELTTHGETQEFEYTDHFGRQMHGFVVCWHSRLLAYRNLCPHWSSKLNVHGSFFPKDGEHIVCQVHGARFEVESGQCVAGAALDQELERFRIEFVQGDPKRANILRGSGLSL